MKKHYLASGEVIYKKNIKELPEGMFSAEYICYDSVGEGSVYEAVGELSQKPAAVEFTIQKECYGDLNFKEMVKILMQSDLLMADWKDYKIKYL